MAKLGTSITKLSRREAGLTMVEYGLLLAVLAVICLAAVTLIRKNLSKQFNSAATSIGTSRDRGGSGGGKGGDDGGGKGGDDGGEKD